MLDFYGVMYNSNMKIKTRTKTIGDGTILTVPSDSDMHKRYLKLNSLEDYFQYKYIKYDVEKGRIGKGTILDIGGNIGLHTIAYWKLVSNDFVVIEAIPGFSKIIKKNVKDNKINNVKVKTIALAEKKGEIEFLLPSSNFGSASFVLKDMPGIKVKAKCENAYDYLTKLKIEKLAFVKVDIEGAEKFIMGDLFKYFSENGHPDVRIEVWATFSKDKNWRTLHKESKIVRDNFWKYGYKLLKRSGDDFFLTKGKKNSFRIFLSDSRIIIHDFFVWNFKNRFKK